MSKIVWDESGLVELSSGQNVAEALLAARGLNDEEINSFIVPNYEFGLSSYELLPDVAEATSRINKAITDREKITIYGDYDIDGLTATTLMYDALTKMGAKVEMYIPDRFDEGYGLNTEALLSLKGNGVDLVISVDCGTTAHEQAEKAKNAGLDIIITDHHEPDGDKPKGCVACVNPKLSKNIELHNLAGVGVAYYLVRALQNSNNLLVKGQEKWLLDLVALGTICDVVPLTGDNRVLASFGLKVMRRTRRAGLLNLAEASGIDIKNVTESDLGFKLGPRLNAAGRLAHAKSALNLLTTNDSSIAHDAASELNTLNSQRQDETQQIFAEARKMANKYRDQPVLVLSSPDWSHGVVGIVASRIAEKVHKPTILLQELNETTKGSARSFNDFSIIDAISSCSELLEKFGGHKFAAGLTIKTDRIDEFRYRINEYAIANMDPKNNFRTISVNVYFPNTISPSLEVYDQLNALSPFGNSNPRPLCKSEFSVSEVRMVGSDASHLRLRLLDSANNEHVAIGFGMANNWPWLEQGSNIILAFNLTENIWREQRSHQLEIVDMHAVEHKNSTIA